MLQWRLQKTEAPMFRARLLGDRRERVNQVYRSTLRMLNRWLASATEGGARPQRWLVARQGSVVLCTAENRYIAALSVMRYLMDGNDEQALDGDLQGVRVRGAANYLFPDIIDGRICMRAVLLCLYASIVKILGAGQPVLWERLMMMLTELVIVNLSDEHTEKGFVVFDWIPGMPLWPFVRTLRQVQHSIPWP
ncbi:hypothetical protein AWV79_02410 [Cupriavidus sp. UYMMa02A]|nr:hypothetical protein AWV79_02410 [Cupriavidus sp. UYMMa02A]